MDSGNTKLKAFDFLKEAAVQLITLALGAVVFSATFYKDIIGGTPKHHLILECSWGLFVFSILFGILVVGGLSWQLNYAAGPESLDIYSSRWTVLLQLVTFLFATALFASFVASNMSSAAAARQSPSTSVSGPVLANGPITATGPLTATGTVSVAGSVTAAGPINAAGPITIRRIAKSHSAVKIRKGR